ncbi:MAG: hypothetical protein DWQ04_17730 [Chloroflexi bacterium]|nr:MAG: hypothetical protein DWQ04_17730 [Chloroflexota bacterium]
MPILNGSNQAIWQSKVAPDVQGRVFSVRRLIAQITAPVAVAIAGPLADNVFEPAMNGGALEPVFSWLVGTGPGAGMSLMFFLFGGVGAVVGLGGYLFPAVRNAEDILPDHEVVAKTAVLKNRVQELTDKRHQLKNSPDTPEILGELQSISRELRQIGTEYQQIAWKKG